MVFHFSTWTTTASLFDARRVCSRSSVRPPFPRLYLSYHHPPVVTNLFRPVVPSVVVVSSPDPHRRHRTALLIAFPRATVTHRLRGEVVKFFAAPFVVISSIVDDNVVVVAFVARIAFLRRRVARTATTTTPTTKMIMTTQKEFNCKKANRVSFFETLVSKDSRYVLRVKNLCRNIHVGIHLHGQTDGQTT